MRALIVASLFAAVAVTNVADARRSLWANGRDRVNRNTAGASDYITSLQKLKHLAVEHHSLVPPHIRTATGAFNLVHDDKVFNDRAVDNGVTSMYTEDLPYWTFLGSAVATDDYVRLTPNRQSQQGAVWNLEPLDLPSFELRVGIRVHSKANVGADGMAVWIVDELPATFGPTFGLPSKFHGLGILVDTYDNDSNRDNPVISLIYSSEEEKANGGRSLNVANDYKNDVLGRCTIDFRNQVDSTILVLRYRAPAAQHDNGNIELSVIRTSGPQGKNEVETSCVTVPATQAPLALGDRDKRYWLGATAETGGMSDNHDLVFMAVLPLAGVEYEKDIHHASHDEVEKEIRNEEVNGERMHRYVHKKDKEERDYWRAKTPQEEEDERKAKAQAYLDQLNREAEAAKAERERKFREEEMREREQQQNNNGQQQQQQQQQNAAHHPPRHELHDQHSQQQGYNNQQQHHQQQNSNNNNNNNNNGQQQQQQQQQQGNANYNNNNNNHYNNNNQQQHQQNNNQQQYNNNNNYNNNGHQQQNNNHYNNNQQQQQYQNNNNNNNNDNYNNQQQYNNNNNNNNGQQYNNNNNNGQQQQRQQQH